MAARKSSKRTLSGWVDESVPGERPSNEPQPQNTRLRELLRRNKIEPDPFIQGLASRVGRYRDEMRVRRQMPTVAHERVLVRRLLQHSRELHELLDDELPPRVHAMLRELAITDGLDILSILPSIRTDLGALFKALSAVEPRVAAMPAPEGRKPATPREALVKAVLRQLEALKVKARERPELARQILVLCDIYMPVDESALRKAVGPRRQ